HTLMCEPSIVWDRFEVCAWCRLYKPDPILLLQSELVPQPQIVDELAIAHEIRLAQILQQAPALAHHHEQTTAAVMILRVLAEMFGEVVDACSEQRDLNGGAATIVLVQLVL